MAKELKRRLKILEKEQLLFLHQMGGDVTGRKQVSINVRRGGNFTKEVYVEGVRVDFTPGTCT